MLVLIKAVIPAYVEAGRLPALVQVRDHVRSNVFIRPSVAIRHKAIEPAPNQFKPLMVMVTMKPTATKPGTAESEPSIERDAMVEGSRRLPNG